MYEKNQLIRTYKIYTWKWKTHYNDHDYLHWFRTIVVFVSSSSSLLPSIIYVFKYGALYENCFVKLISRMADSIQATYVVRFKDESQGVKRNLTRSVAHPTTWPAKGWPLALEPVLRSCKMQEASFETAGHQISTPLLFPNKNSFAMRPNDFCLSR